MDISKEEMNVLSDALSVEEKTLEKETPRDDFERLLNSLDIRDYGRKSPEEMFWLFFTRGMAVASKYEEEVSIDELIKNIDINEFLKDVEDFINGINKGETPTYNPFVNLLDGNKIVKINLDEVVKNDFKIS